MPTVRLLLANCLLGPPVCFNSSRALLFGYQSKWWWRLHIGTQPPKLTPPPFLPRCTLIPHLECPRALSHRVSMCLTSPQPATELIKRYNMQRGSWITPPAT